MKTAFSTVLHFTMRDDGIVWAESQPGIEPTEQLLQEAEAACRILRRDKMAPALWDIRRLTKPKPDAWLGFIKGAPDNLTAVAVLGDPDHIELLGSFPAIINKLQLPFRLFTDETSALEWLLDFV